MASSLPWILALLAAFSISCSAESEPDEPLPSARVDEAGPGRWKEFRTHRFDTDIEDEQKQMLARLEAIGYASGSTSGSGDSGVAFYDRARTQAGPNLYTSGHAPEARLISMTGEVLHVWRSEFWQVWPDYPVERDDPKTAYWRRALLFPNGDLLATFPGLGLLKLDKDSKLLWAQPNRAHHDLDVLPNGDIYVLTREAHIIPRVSPSLPILEDFISVHDRHGVERRRVSVLTALESSRYAHLFRSREKHTGDIFHTNSIEVLRADLPAAGPAFRAGNVLISMRELNAVAIVDMEQEKVVWTMEGSFRRQHDPHALADGQLLMFDNRGLGKRSRALEVDIATRADGWSYRGSDAEFLYSRWCGAVQRLENGNTVITESDNGRALEVTRAGERVWEFHNPHRAGEDGRFVASLFDVVRLPHDFPVDWVNPIDGTGDQL